MTMTEHRAVSIGAKDQRGASRRRVSVRNGGIRFESGANAIELPAAWWRDQTTEVGQIEATNRQRIFTPLDIPADLEVVDARLEPVEPILAVAFSDGHVASIDLAMVERLLGWRPDPEEPPSPRPWTAPIDPFPYVAWDRVGVDPNEEDPAAIVTALGAFFEHGYVVFRGVPTEPGTIRHVADRLGYLVGTNFGDVFDVRTEPRPTDLAYTSLGLPAHTDQPYRDPAPGIQMLHCLRNEAPGGDSTLVDGLAATQWLAEVDPAGHAALVDTRVVFRYDMGADTVVSYGHVIEVDHDGTYRQIKLNTKLDTPLPADGRSLDDWYRGRRLLCEWLSDPAHRVTFRLEPGDLMFMDNLRALHGRTGFDSSAGARHLQGCYIEHDGPGTRYRLAVRRLRGSS
ncbi:MAG: TauD/TfdA family dioxygenase [Actinomycetota bacterium]